MLRALGFAAARTAPTATTWWFGPLGGFLAAGLLWIASVPVTFSEFLPNSILRSGFEALVCVVLAYLVIFVFWLGIFPVHRMYEAQGGIRTTLQQRLGAQMGPFVLIGIGFLSFAALTSAGLIWLTVQVLNGTTMKGLSVNTPNTVGNPDFSLQIPEGRYKFRWDPSSDQTKFDLRLDTERNPDFSNNPAFVLRNKTNTVAYNVTAVWKSEIASTVEQLTKSPRLAKYKFDVGPTKLVVMAAAGSMGIP